MTRRERLLARALLERIEGATPAQAVERLLGEGLLNLAACDRLAICDEVLRLERQGTPRCEALLAAADTFCCSYEKARNCFYNQIKKTRP